MLKRLSTIFRTKHILVLFLVFLLTVSGLTLFIEKNPNLVAEPTLDNEILEFEGTYDWETTLDVMTPSTDYISYSDFRDNYCLAGTSTSTCASSVSGKYIRFDTAEELYRWSMDVSYDEVYTTGNPTEDVKLASDKIAMILSLDYVLGKDIDYSIMGSKAFIPIGYAFTDVDELDYERSFTGTFDGRGFEIQDLYVAGYDYLVVERLVQSVYVDFALSEHYSMFNYNEGTIKNLGLINPNLEILQLHIDITKLSNLVGFNMSTGVIQNVYVIDNRTSVTLAGMRYQVGTSSSDFQAAGIVHTNQGTFTDSYYSSLVVMNGNFINKFDVQPVVYNNTGTISRLVFDDDVYQEMVTVSGSTFIVDTPNGLATSETTSTLKSSSSSLSGGSTSWYYYPSDGYPLLKGYDFNETDNVYEIDSAMDLAFLPDVIKLTSQTENSTTYNHESFRLVANIDMSVLAPDAYQTPSVTFYGTLSGYNPVGTDLGDNYYIHDLVLNQNVLRGLEYYSGLFSILGSGAKVEFLNITRTSSYMVDTDSYYSYDSYIGTIAGKLVGATISNVQVDSDIYLGTEALGITHAGGIVGLGSGIIENTSNHGDIFGGTHIYNSSFSIKPVYNIGGIVGTANGALLSLDNTVNHGTINGIATASDITLSSGYTEVIIRIGGVIGYINNTSLSNHQLVSVANHGNIVTGSFKSTVQVPAVQYIGGVFGELTGLAPVLEESSEYKFANLYNSGDIYHSYIVDTADILSAGIGINNASEAIEYALLFNHGTFFFSENAATYTQTQFDYVSLIYDISSSNVILSRSYNYGILTLDSNIYHDVSGLYTSVNSNYTILRYVANYGDINFLDNSGTTQISLATDLVIAGITRDTNVDYLNVYNYGDINVVNINLGVHDLYIAGFNDQLASGKYIKNSLNDGNINVAEISGSGNIYIAGIVNTNYSGDLQDAGQSTTQPTATIGIINTINSGDISTSYGLEAAGLYGIHGTSNTFIGGITSLNKGSIQHSANLGDIRAYNSNTSSTFSYETSSTYAGLVITYNSGIVAGGIAANVIGGDSRIYDTANNGDVLITANKYVRAGGILGTSLYRESQAGGITSGMGLTDDIQNSILSNGLNFGNISALSDNIASYGTSSYSTTITVSNNAGLTAPSYSISTVTGNEERPPIYSSAGGVIGYGLSVMQNMLNHGTISATDVAGGVVGATYVLGNITTDVNITTAINYGEIKAVSNSNVASINKYSLSYSDISSYFMADGNTFIFPTSYTRESPGTKRGFGGIFGRLQRGLSGIMTSENGAFDFIVNANENIDLIGRLDQVHNFSSSSQFFRFNDAIYYSANMNDTTQVVFSGFYIGNSGTVLSYTGSRRNWTLEVEYDDYYHQVGVVATYLTNQNETFIRYPYSTSNSAPSIGSTYTGTTYYFGGAVIPWITEDPSDGNITDYDNQYFYAPNFPMRTNPDLTEYIYYMTNDLLASRFTTSRPNGMYVLSTSAGQSYGSVIPKNIDISSIKMINEDYTSQISLLMSYDVVSPMYKDAILVCCHDDLTRKTDLSFTSATKTISSVTTDLSVYSDGDTILIYGSGDNDGIYTVNGTPTTNSLVVNETLVDEVAGNEIIISSTRIEIGYEQLKQTTFNDKSELIPNDSVYVTLAENNGSNTILSIPTIDYINKTVTFSISMEAYDDIQSSASYLITDALTSLNALIAITPDDYYGHSPSSAELEALNNILYSERYSGISTSYPAQLSVNPLPDDTITVNQTEFAGSFAVYSEAFIGDDLYATSVYYTVYDVYIEFTPESTVLPGTTQIETVAFNGGLDTAVIDTTDVRSLGDVNSSGSIKFSFQDSKGLLTQGYDFKNNFVLKYNDGTIVNSSFYTVTSNPVDIVSNIGYYDITFTFSDSIAGGDYYFEYRYFPNSTLYTIWFDKLSSSNSSILDFTYYSEQNSLNIVSNTITSYVNIGMVIEGTGVDYMDTLTNNYSSSSNGLPTYQSNIDYDIDFMTNGSLEISPFASVTSARLVQTTITNGYKTYQMEYIITAEDGITSTTYTHNLIERTVDLESVLKDGNNVVLNDIHVLRETLSTEFTIDLGFDQNLDLYIIESGVYSYLEISVVGTTNDGLTTYTPEQIVGISYSASDYLYITMSYETLPGIYTFSFKYYRDGSSTDFVTYSTNLVIEKDKGSDAYLSDIKFSQLLNETAYPDMSLTDVSGTVISSSYVPSVYFGGIDYDGADDAGWPYFRIDGKVSKVPLNNYTPYFLDYLPYGATISRYAYDTDTSSWYWTTEVDSSSSQVDRATLATDFTVYPDTGLEPAEGEFVMIKYRVTAEDGLTQVYYYITVTDITYNLSIVFDIYYCEDETRTVCQLASDSVDFNDELVMISVQNLDTDGDDTVVGVVNPIDYPTFTTVNSVNNKATQFYYTGVSDFTYKFGRNIAGFYVFDLELPVDQYLNDQYDFDIEYDTYFLNDASDYVSALNGKYYYIENATVIRTRRFNVYIYPLSSPSSDVPYGLFDFFVSWFEG
jgi:hypothetical protein